MFPSSDNIEFDFASVNSKDGSPVIEKNNRVTAEYPATIVLV